MTELDLIGPEEMAQIYGCKSAAAFQQLRLRKPDLVPPHHFMKKWNRPDVLLFIKERIEESKRSTANVKKAPASTASTP